MPATSTEIPPDAVRLAKALVAGMKSYSFQEKFTKACPDMYADDDAFLFSEQDEERLFQLILSVWPSEDLFS